MTDNPYQTPESELINPDHAQTQQQFYVVSTKKLALLFVATIGLYGFFWFFAHWQKYKRATGQSIWPLARAVFSIFFAHKLFLAIDKRLKDKESNYAWDPYTWALIFVLTIIGSAILAFLDNIIGEPGKYNDVIEYGTLVVELIVLLNVQKAANISQNDQTGSSNSNITMLNIVWLIFGFVFWVITFITFAETLGWIDINQLLFPVEE